MRELLSQSLKDKYISPRWSIMLHTNTVNIAHLFIQQRRLMWYLHRIIDKDQQSKTVLSSKEKATSIRTPSHLCLSPYTWIVAYFNLNFQPSICSIHGTTATVVIWILKDHNMGESLMIRRSAKMKCQSKGLGQNFHISQFALVYLRARMLAHKECYLTKGISAPTSSFTT